MLTNRYVTYPALVIALFLLFSGTMHAQVQDDKEMQKGQLIEAPDINVVDNNPGEFGSSFGKRRFGDNSLQSVNTIYSEDFEDSLHVDSTWTMTPGWEFGESTSVTGDTGNVAGTDLDADYQDNMDDTLTSPLIELPETRSGETINLVFDEWFELESGYDYGYVAVSTDTGETWTQIRVIDGSAAWRTVALELTQYAGQNIMVAFRATSDGSYSNPGWYVDNVKIQVDPLDPVNTEITSVNHSSYPNVYMNVVVDTFGTGIPSLTESDFTIKENGTVQTDEVSITPPDSGASVRRADIVFLMDNSGSMDEEQQAVEDNVFSFVDSLENRDVDYQLGLTRYGQSADGGEPILVDNGSLTDDPSYFKNSVWTQNTVDGND